MQKSCLFILSLLVSNYALATNGYLYYHNVNDVFHSQNQIQFKIEVKNSSGNILKSLETTPLDPTQIAKYRLADLSTGNAYLFVSAKDKSKNTAYNLCLEGYPLSNNVQINVRGWSTSANATCELGED